MDREGEMEARPLPEPLPPPPATRRLSKKQRAGVAGGVAVVLLAVVLSCVGLVTRGVPALLSGLEPPELRYRGAWWAGDGAFAVAQSADSNGRPFVLVAEKRTGRVRRVDGRRVVAVEPHAAELWLMPDNGAGRSRYDYEPSGDQADPVPRVLIRWRLDDGTSPVRVGAAITQWRPWPGPDGRVATSVIDRSRGAWPSHVAFSSAEGTSEVRTPDMEGTLAPIGWSPSGRYFAAYELQRPLRGAEAARLEAEDGEGEGGDPFLGEPRRVIFDTTTGKVAAEEDPGTNTFVAGEPWAAWDPSADVLYFPYMKSESSGEDDEPPTVERMSVAAIEASSGVRSDAFAGTRWPKPKAFESTDQVLLLGGGPSGPVFMTDTPDAQAWCLGPKPRRLSVDPQEGMPMAWSEQGGLVCWSTDGDIVVQREDGRVETTLLKKR